MDHQRRLAVSPFPEDTGAATSETRRLIAAAATEGTSVAYLRAVAALCGDRLLVPVVAATTTRLGQTLGGLTSDKEAEMSVVTLQRPDGHRALLVFTGLDAVRSWRLDARPVPVTLDVAAQAARSEELTALLIDVAGPHTLVLEGEILVELAVGHRLIELSDGEFGWIIPAPD